MNCSEGLECDSQSVVLLWPFCGNQSRCDEFHMLFNVKFNVKFSEYLKYKHEVKRGGSDVKISY